MIFYKKHLNVFPSQWVFVIDCEFDLLKIICKIQTLANPYCVQISKIGHKRLRIHKGKNSLKKIEVESSDIVYLHKQVLKNNNETPCCQNMFKPHSMIGSDNITLNIIE